MIESEEMGGRPEQLAQVNAGKADAAFENGVLELRLPKVAEVRPKTIEVKPKAAVEGEKS